MTDSDQPFAPPVSTASSPGERSTLDTAAGVMFLISGTMLCMWALWSVIGVLTGGLMSVAMVASGDEELLIGLPILLIYGVWLVVSAIAGPVQLVAGVQIFRNRASKPLLWAASIAGLASAITVYCAMTGMVSFGLGLASVLSKPE